MVAQNARRSCQVNKVNKLIMHRTKKNNIEPIYAWKTWFFYNMASRAVAAATRGGAAAFRSGAASALRGAAVARVQI